MTAPTFRHRHLLGIEPLDREDIVQILDLADTFLEISARPIKKVPTLRGRTIINLFLEASTRTRTSFEIAAKRLSADAVNISGSSSSTVKGETLLDTARNLMAMAPDVIVMRHAASGGCNMVASHVACAVVNAGDGTHEHPSQALLDAATIRKHKGRVEGQYFLALCLGYVAINANSGAFDLLPEIVNAGKAAAAINESYAYGGPQRLLGMVYLRAPGWPTSIGDPDEALQHLTRAVTIGPDYAPNHLFYAEALLANEKRTEALHEVERAMSLSPPTDPLLLRQLAQWKADAEALKKKIVNDGG